MESQFQFGSSIEFSPPSATETLRLLPAAPGILCLRGPRPTDEPYLTRTADLRRRAMRLLAPPESTRDGVPILSRRLNLRDRVARIEWTATGSGFEGLLVLYHATAAAFGPAEARRRLRLHTPSLVRFTAAHAHPRLYVTNRLSRGSLADTFGPFASRAAAERYVEAVLDLFKLRRCHEDLEPYPEHPGCVYQEMKKCLAPCNHACTPEQYATEAGEVRAFLATRGESMLATIGTQREHASEQMDFERAAALHTQYGRVKGAAILPGDLVHPLPSLRAVIVQASPPPPTADLGQPPHDHSDDKLEAAVFLLERGCLAGPHRLSTLGVRAVKEQTSVGSSLFAQPLMLQAVPLEAPTSLQSQDSPEARAAAVLAALASSLRSEPADPATLSDHLSLIRRWFYRPEKQRTGEIFFPNEDGTWPIRRILRGAARMALGDPKPMAETDRAGVPAARVKILHEGREGVERVVPLIAAATRTRRTRKPALSIESAAQPAAPGTPSPGW